MDHMVWRKMYNLVYSIDRITGILTGRIVSDSNWCNFWSTTRSHVFNSWDCGIGQFTVIAFDDMDNYSINIAQIIGQSIV